MFLNEEKQDKPANRNTLEVQQSAVVALSKVSLIWSKDPSNDQESKKKTSKLTNALCEGRDSRSKAQLGEQTHLF